MPTALGLDRPTRNPSLRWRIYGTMWALAASLLIAGCGPRPEPGVEAGAEAGAEAESPGDRAAIEETASASSAHEVVSSPERLTLITQVERQAFVSQARRVVEAMRFVGSPLSDDDTRALAEAMELSDDAQAVAEIQTVLNRYTLVAVHINPEARVKVSRGECEAKLQEQGWRAFLVRVHNEPHVTARLAVESANSGDTMDFAAEGTISESDVRERWMKIAMSDAKPLNEKLSGLPLEYRILTLFSRDAGQREGHLAFNIGHGTQDIGFRNDVYVLFECESAVTVALSIRDTDASPATCALVIQDQKGQLYPLPARRVAPDFFFQEQIYRADGESVMLPPGQYQVTYSRGPEYLRETLALTVEDTETQTLAINLHRWTNPTAKGWISGDHHIHASGCSHYQSPDVGVTAEVMLRHIEGEGLSIGSVLSWGPGWEHQKRNFSGSEDDVSTARNVIRYDVEVSQFPSDHTGHLCLLRLSEDDYPGTTTKDEWPSWGLPIVQWAKAQGAVTGVAHSGWGLDISPEDRLPNYVVPPMDGIGAQEFIVQAAHHAVDFISTADTPYVWELNMWYHLLNCGFPIKASGETDFPCIYDERVGLGRSYVKFDDPDNLNFDDWIRGVQAGRSYVSDGYSHIQEFRVNGIAPGGVENSILDLDDPQAVEITANVSAWLDDVPRTVFQGTRKWDTLVQDALKKSGRETTPIRDLKYTVKPYWHIERARIDDTRTVPVELIVNGQPVARQEIRADGTETSITFSAHIERSSWIALRILASSHTNPVTVQLGGAPVRASKLSAEWCLDGIDQVWLQKVRNIRLEERAEAYEAYDVAREVFRQIAAESHDDSALITGADLLKRQQQHLDISEDMKVMRFAMTKNKGVLGVVRFDRTAHGFSGDLLLNLSVTISHATIHYTLDGSRPTADSPVYSDGIMLSESTQVSARGFVEDEPCTNMVTARYTQYSTEDYGEELRPGETHPGLNYSYYEGDWIQFRDVTDAALIAEDIAASFSLNVAERDRYYALSFRGYIRIPVDGVYAFGTTSNDGSLLYIDDKLVVNNDGLHTHRTVTGDIPLQAGLHSIRSDYFNAGGSWEYAVTWEGPEFAMQPIPADVLSRTPMSTLNRPN